METELPATATGKTHIRHKTMTKHHRHSAHHHQDAAEIFKQQNFRATKRRKALSKLLFTLLTIIAILTTAIAIYLYTIE